MRTLARVSVTVLMGEKADIHAVKFIDDIAKLLLDIANTIKFRVSCQVRYRTTLMSTYNILGFSRANG